MMPDPVPADLPVPALPVLPAAEEAAPFDRLTGLESPSLFLCRLQDELAEAARGGRSGLLAVCDIDGFAAINRWYGAAAGDGLLCRLGQSLARRVGEDGAVARLGADHFAILLPGTEPDGGRRRMRDILRGLDRARFDVDGTTIPLAVTAGIAAYRAGDSGADVLQRARLTLDAARRHRAELPAH